MTYLAIIAGAIAAGVYTAAGLFYYLVLAGRTRSHLMKMVWLTGFLVLGVGGGIAGCAMIVLFTDGARVLPAFALLLWLGSILVCVSACWRGFARRLGLSTADKSVSETKKLDQPPDFISKPAAPPPDRAKLGYVPALDGLRGFAILCVMASHGTPFLQGGLIGVDVFFVLSGFLITTLLVQEFDGTNSISLTNFYLRRVLRLGPALLVMLAVFCCLSFAALNGARAHNNLVDAIIALGYSTNWALALHLHNSDYLAHTWSLSIEEQFYLLWPVGLLLHVSRQRRHIVLATLVIAAMCWASRSYHAMNVTSFSRSYYGLDTRADSLMTGCCLAVILNARLISETVLKLLQKILVVTAPAAVAGLLVFAVYARGDHFMMDWGFTVVEVLAAIMILDIFVNRQSLVKKLLTMNWLVWIGSISYGLYLWHYPIYRALADAGYDAWIVFAVGSVLSFLVAALSYYSMEKPILAFKVRKFSQNQAQPLPAELNLKR
jgi:peptidoglycan/LPS O-acetylase OafA/YrhL